MWGFTAVLSVLEQILLYRLADGSSEQAVVGVVVVIPPAHPLSLCDVFSLKTRELGTGIYELC